MSTIKDLQDKLKNYGVKNTGSKEELTKRLKDYMAGKAVPAYKSKTGKTVQRKKTPSSDTEKEEDFASDSESDTGSDSESESESGSEDSSSESTKKSSKKITKKPEKYHLILFDAPIDLVISKEDKDYTIKIPDSIYRAIEANTGDKSYNINKDENDYVFGESYAFSQYEKLKLGVHDPILGLTGLIDFDKVKPGKKLDIDVSVFDDTLYDNPAALRKIQKQNPAVLWLGENLGKKANLYGHKDEKTGVLDSLLVASY